MYLPCLLVSLCGLGILDYTKKLALFYDCSRTLKTIGVVVGIFIIWDLLGIASNIFFVGSSAYLTGIRLAPEFPLEEIFFLMLLTYTALIVWRLAGKLWPRT